MFDLKGKTALVTGGASGIGKAIVTALCALGASIVIADVSEAAALALCKELKDESCVADFINTDVSDSKSVKAAVGYAAEKYRKLDIMVNDAGLLSDKRIWEITDAEWRRLMNVNLDGVFYCCREAVIHMKENGGGKIINIASAGGKLGFPYAGVHYCASKGGVMALTRQLASQVAGYGIRVNAVAPGTTATRLIENRPLDKVEYIINKLPLRRLGTPQDTAAAVALLASDSSNYMTGETIDVNGGLYLD